MNGKTTKKSKEGSKKKKLRDESESEETKPKRLKTSKNAKHVECNDRGGAMEEIGGNDYKEDVPHSSGKTEIEDQEKELSKIVVCVHTE